VVLRQPGEGKSTVCIATAEAALEMLSGGVLLVDGDLRRPTLGARLGVSAESDACLSSYLADPRPSREAFALLPRSVPGSEVELLPAGPPIPSPASLLALPSLAALIRKARGAWDLVIFDTPPVTAGPDASLIAARTDGAILVVDARRSRRAAVEFTLEHLGRANVNVLGVIVNRVSREPTLAYNYAGEEGQSGDRGRQTPQPAPAAQLYLQPLQDAAGTRRMASGGEPDPSSPAAGAE
jgi:capsular exopolysaccharide synthesis family protein